MKAPSETTVNLGLGAIIVGAIGFGFYYVLGTGPFSGKVTQNGHTYSRYTSIFGGTATDGSGQQYDLTGSVGDTVSAATQSLTGPTGALSNLTPAAQDKATIAIQNGWIDSDGNLTTQGQQAIDSGAWAQAGA